MVIGPGHDPTPAEAEDFAARWPAMLAARLRWFEDQVGSSIVLDGSTASLEPLLGLVVDRLSSDAAVEPPPEWFNEVLRQGGWTPYGAALVEGLSAYVAEIHRRRVGPAADWVLEVDPKSAYYLQPVPRGPGLPPAWVQVWNAVGKVRRGGPTDSLQAATEYVLRGLASAPAPDRAEEPLVVLTRLGDRRWQVSLPEDLPDTLGQERYAELEDRFAALPGVESALFEDREVCLLRTTPDVDAVTLRTRLEGVLRSEG